MKIEYSVVMPVYWGNTPEEFDSSINSLLNQNLLPSEIIIVCDGLLTDTLNSYIDNISFTCNIIRIIRLSKNCGQGFARDVGIRASKFNLIGLMDADDISLPIRFLSQVSLLANNTCDVIGGQIVEFDPNNSFEFIRIVPLNHDHIYKLSKKRNPMNNVTVCFKKDIYFKAGGFRAIRGYEDWDLYIRMLLVGAKFINLDTILCHVRVNNQMYKRRGGLKLLVEEYKFLYNLYSINFCSFFDFFENILIRSLVRLIPANARASFYKNFLRDRR